MSQNIEMGQLRPMKYGGFATPIMTDPAGYFEPWEVHKIIEACEDILFKLYLLILWRTGCRESEALEITPVDVDGKNNKLIITTLKRRRKRKDIIDIDDTLAKIFKEQTRDLPKNEPFMKHYRYLKNVDRRNWRRIVLRKFVQICAKVGLDKKGSKGKSHIHHLRHSYCINYIRQGGTIEKLQKQTRHASLDSLSYYLNFKKSEVTMEYLSVWEQESKWEKNLFKK